MRVAIFDYGAGNLFSLKNALERQGAEVAVHTTVGRLATYDAVFLPGVGNFDPAMQSITAGSDFAETTRSMPVFGICLGMEMFFARSQEGGLPGLDVMEGDVIMLPRSMKIPHMGWNSLDIRHDVPLLEDVPQGSWVYFVHSYRANPADDAVVVATSTYDVTIPAIVQKDNYTGTQFHPEKSGDTGMKIIRNFLHECVK